MASSNKLQVHMHDSSYVLAANGTMKPLSECSSNEIVCFAFIFLLVAPLVGSEVTHMDCRKDVSFASPNYPSPYPNRANENKLITAPKGSRILVTFTDFNVEEDDFLYLDDKVVKQNSKRYTGEEMEFPPFLTKGNELEMTFISLSSGTRRGFNVSTSCYNNTRDASLARIVGGNSPGKGFLELRTQSDDWRRVCKDSFHERVTEVACGELGYPAVKKVSNGTDDCISPGQDCMKAPICKDYAFILEDCSWSSGDCSSADAVKVECYEPGYKGCYHPEDFPQQNGSIFESTSQCLSSCRAKKRSREALATMIGTQCLCYTADEVNLPNITPAGDHSTCINTTHDTRPVVNALVYDVSVGFCDELDDVMNGSWDSDITWFGFIVHLTCDDGYSLHGSGALQCVPGLSPYHPIWNGSLPTCDMPEDDTSKLSASNSLNPDEYTGEQPKREISNRYYLFFLIAVGCMVLFSILKRKRIGKKLSAWRSKYTIPGNPPSTDESCQGGGRESPSEHEPCLPFIGVKTTML